MRVQPVSPPPPSRLPPDTIWPGISPASARLPGTSSKAVTWPGVTALTCWYSARSRDWGRAVLTDESVGESVGTAG
jgi:hypothetical protein